MMSIKEAIVMNGHGVGQYAYCERMPQWGETLSVKNWHIAEDGGKGSNVAVALGRLGVKSAYIGKVGYDPWGDLGEKWMQDAGVDVTWLYRTHEVSTGTALILIGKDGQNTVIDGDGSGRALKEEEIILAIDAMQGSQYFITGFEVPERLALFAAEYAKSKGMKTVLNPSPLPEEPMGRLEYVDYLFINKIEGSSICGIKEELSEVEILKKVRERYGTERVIMTLGEEGVMALIGEEVLKVPGRKVKPVNTAGAGDGFMAATIAGMIKGKSLKEAMDWASYYAALSVTIEGTIPAYRYPQEVEEFIRKYKEIQIDCV